MENHLQPEGESMRSTQDPAAGDGEALFGPRIDPGSKERLTDRAGTGGAGRTARAASIASGRMEKGAIDALSGSMKRIEQVSCSGNRQAQLRPQTGPPSWSTAPWPTSNKKLAAKEAAPQRRKPAKKNLLREEVTQDRHRRGDRPK